MPNYVGPSQSASFGGQITSRTMGSGNPRPSSEIDLSKLVSEELREEERDLETETKKLGGIRYKDFKVSELTDKFDLNDNAEKVFKDYNKIYITDNDTGDTDVFYFAKTGEKNPKAKNIKKIIVAFNSADKDGINKGTLMMKKEKEEKKPQLNFFQQDSSGVKGKGKVASFDQRTESYLETAKGFVKSIFSSEKVTKFAKLDFSKGKKSEYLNGLKKIFETENYLYE